jgi:predicted anti-sigma-YlaC factor YlaD
MKEDLRGHLGQDRIIMAIIDETDLTSAENDHLANCPECAGAKQALALQLFRLSEATKRYTPDQQRKVVLPTEEAETGKGWISRWNMGLVTAAACLVLIIAISLPNLFTGGSLPYGNVNLAAETAADAKLMAEIDSLVESSLPASLQKVVPDPGAGMDADEDVLDLMVPVGAG